MGHTGPGSTFATVAQLAEQRFCKPQVNGSSPFGGFVNHCSIKSYDTQGKPLITVR